jgi:hypothetical protein
MRQEMRRKAKGTQPSGECQEAACCEPSGCRDSALDYRQS